VGDIPYIGELFALAAPLSWSFAVILFRVTGRSVPPVALNLFKNLLALALFFGTLLLIGSGPERTVSRQDYYLLILSGAIGIGISDALFFMTLNRVGAGLQAIINTFYSPSIILLSLLFLNETFTLPQFLGVALILTAVLSVSGMRGPQGEKIPRTVLLGILLGMSAAMTQAISIVMIKPLLNHSPLVWANSWRLVGGVAASLLLTPLFPRWKDGLRTLLKRDVWKVMLPASLLGSYVSLMFWLAGMKYTQASTASALNQTSTLWTFVLAAWLLHEPVTRKRLIGLGVGLAGVALVTFTGIGH